jgi:hypothetical protein
MAAIVFSSLRHCAIIQKVEVSIPVEVVSFFD